MTRVSVIIPAYNYARFLGDAIQSVLDQTFTDFELIVVDDGSTDNTREVVDSFKDSRIRYIYQENRGLSAAENTGIKASHGEYIAILGADDIWLPQNLELKVKALDYRPDIGLVCSDAWLFDNKTGDTISRYWHDKPSYHSWVDPRRAAREPLKELLYFGCFIPPQATVVRRLVFTKVGYFDESLLNYDDWDMFVRIVKLFPIEIIDVPLVRLRRHGDNMGTNWEKMFLGEAVVLHKAIRNYSLSKEELELVRIRQRGLRRRALELLRDGRQAIRSGKVAVGREALLTYIKINPWGVRPYFYLALSFLGSRGILMLRTRKIWLMYHFVRRQPSGDAQIISK